MEKNLVVLYKNQPAIIVQIESDKFVVSYCSQPATSTGKKAVYSEQKVREKDIIPLHPKTVKSLESVLNFSNDKIAQQLAETYELLQSDESTATEPISLNDIAELTFGSFEPEQSWFLYNSLINSFEFEQNQDELKNRNLVFIPRTQEQIQQLKQKDYEKSHADEIKNAFIQRLKQKKLDLPSDSKFMGEVEAFALCKTDKSKILSEAGFSQNIEKAHKLLIDTGIWDFTKNPHPTRFGFSFDSAREQLGSMPQEEREKVPCVCYAIDASDSVDPDDAIGFDGKYFWVCIADPASSVLPDSTIDTVARGRGTTLYIPEGASRMLCESSLEEYALGLKERSGNGLSNALAFRLEMDEDCQIIDCEIKKVCVQVKMISYKEAEEQKESDELKPFFELARRNLERRNKNNAITIRMPEVRIKVCKETKKVSIVTEERFESNDVIQEFMLLAGEGAAKFAFKNKIPFPYVSQESPVFPKDLPDGWAGEFARVKCMRKRSVGITPAPHSGLGLSFYSQVTSPLRRYSDLVAHQQLRAYINNQRLLDKDEMLERIAAGDAASLAARKASRLSDTHWKLVYLLQNPEKTFEAFCIDKKGSDTIFLIPELDMQTVLKGCGETKLNDKVVLKALSVDVTTQNVDFTKVE